MTNYSDHEYFSNESGSYDNTSSYSSNYTNDSSSDSSNDDQSIICFAVLVHNRKEVVIDLLDNIRRYCPNSTIVLYNGGNDPDLCRDLGYPVCPTSRKLSYGVTAIYMLEVMKWLEDIDKRYDYLINLDSDVLFTKEGYESYILKEMENKDYLGVGTKVPDDDFYCLVQLRLEKKRWEPVLGQEPYLESFNVGQVYSRRLVRRLLSSDEYELFHKNLLETRAFGIDEIAYVTIVDRLKTPVHPYQQDVASTIRYRPHFPLDELISYLNRGSQTYLFHPIHREMKDEARVAIRELMKREIQLDPDIQELFVDKDLGIMPYMIRRSKYSDSTVVEWTAASENEGLLYWKVAAGVLYGPYSFGSGKVSGLTAMESSLERIEILCRVGHELIHYWRNEESGEWFHAAPFAEGVTGMPSIIESSYGSYEVVAPLKSGGLGHWWKKVNGPDMGWFGPTIFGEGQYHDALLLENNANQLTVIVQQGDGYHYFVRDDRYSWQWFGPYD